MIPPSLHLSPAPARSAPKPSAQDIVAADVIAKALRAAGIDRDSAALMTVAEWSTVAKLAECSAPSKTVIDLVLAELSDEMRRSEWYTQWKAQWRALAWIAGAASVVAIIGAISVRFWKFVADHGDDIRIAVGGFLALALLNLTWIVPLVFVIFLFRKLFR